MKLLSAKWFLSFRFPTKTLHTFLFSPRVNTCPVHLILIDLITLIILALQIMKLFIMQFSPVPCYLSPQTPHSRAPSACVLKPAQHLAVRCGLSVRHCANSPLQLTIKIIATLKQVCNPSGQTISCILPKATKHSCVFTTLQHISTCPITPCLIFTNDYRQRIIFSFSSIASVARV